MPDTELMPSQDLMEGEVTPTIFYQSFRPYVLGHLVVLGHHFLSHLPATPIPVSL